MKIVLIRPQRVFKQFNKALKPCPPLGLALLAGSLEARGHCVEIIDAIAEAISQISVFRDDIMIQGLTNAEIIERISPDADIIGVSCMFTVDWLNLRPLINLIGETFPTTLLIAGGEHVTALPELCLEGCPPLKVCVLGEGEETLLEVCDATECGTSLNGVMGIVYRDVDGVVRSPRRKRLKQLDQLPIPAWHLFPTHVYFREKLSFGVGGKPTLPILATRGCPFTCSFCSSPDMWGTQYTMRSVKNVVDEIEYLMQKYGVQNIDLYDLTAIIKSSWILQFCQEILSRGLKLTWQLPSGTRSEAITPEVLGYMKKSGCTVVTYAPESGSDRILQLVNKRVNLKRMLQAIRNSNQAGLIVKINIIFGLPQEKHSDIFKTFWFIIRSSWSGAYDMGPNPFHPIPGTPLFDELSAAGRLNIRDHAYFDSLLNSDNLSTATFYNTSVSGFWLRFYLITSILVFYSTNFLFRPIRFFKTIRNVLTLKSETRGQYVLQRILEQNRFIARRRKRQAIT